MKKKYFSPETILMQIELHQMVAASTLSTTGDTQTVSISEEEVDEFTSRRRSVWDDEEEMEEEMY